MDAIELIVLPGLDGTAILLDAFCARMAAHGIRARALSYPLDQPLDYGKLEVWIRARLPVDREFVLLGESFSGPMAIRIAAARPAGLRALVLSTTFARAPMGRLGLLAPLLRFAPTKAPMPLLSYGLLGRWSDTSLRTDLSTALDRVHPAVLRTRAREALRVNVAEYLKSVTLPCLYFRARQDRLLSRRAVSELVNGLPHCQMVEVDGPHLLLQTRTDAVAAEVAAFVTICRERRFNALPPASEQR